MYRYHNYLPPRVALAAEFGFPLDRPREVRYSKCAVFVSIHGMEMCRKTIGYLDKDKPGAATSLRRLCVVGSLRMWCFRAQCVEFSYSGRVQTLAGGQRDDRTEVDQGGQLQSSKQP